MKKHIVSFVIGLLMLGIGCGYFTFEVLEFDYQNEIDPTVDIVRQSQTYEVGATDEYDIKIQNGVLKVVFDNSLDDTMSITTSYPKDYIDLHYKEEIENHHENELTYHFYDTTKAKDVRRVVERILENISEKRFYNYEKTFSPVVEVRIKEENLKYIDFDKDKSWYD